MVESTLAEYVVQLKANEFSFNSIRFFVAEVDLWSNAGVTTDVLILVHICTQVKTIKGYICATTA